MADAYHKPVLLDEVMAGLEIKPGGVFVDATTGGGGHSREISERLGPGGVVIGIDRDEEALREAISTLAGAPAQFMPFCAPFDEIAEILPALGFPEVDGILYDLGVSSHQLDDPSRGFTFRDHGAPLDMRMSQAEETPTAADLLNTASVEELTVVLRENADERWAARIAQFICDRRASVVFETAGQLIDVVKAAIPAAARSKDIHPATKTFQALRIAVNDEFGRLKRSLRAAARSLRHDGRLVVISYHSGEDRIVKQTFAELAGKCVCPPDVPRCMCLASMPVVTVVTKKPVTPSARELSENPRARSAKLRIVERRGKSADVE
jgi:16S rRNA (cytosine1402-N4)-methyltransferase